MSDVIAPATTPATATVPATQPFWQVATIPWMSGRGRLIQAIELEEQAPQRLVLATIGILVAGLFAFVVWASLTHVTEVATASGEVSPVGTVRKVQHLEGGIVAALYVHEGDHVEAGEPLIELDPASARPELGQLQARLAALQLQQNQLVAFRTGTSAVADLRGTTAFTDMADAQDDVLSSKRAAIVSEKAVLSPQVEQREAEFDALKTQRAQVAEESGLLAQQVAARTELVSKGYASRMGLLDLKRDQAKLQAGMAELDGQIRRAGGSVGEAKARLAELDARSRRETAEDGAKIQAEIAEVRQTLARADDRVQRLVVRAPVRGTVKGLQTETIGGVVPPGSTVMEIIPADVPLVVEARILPKDIGFIRRGQDVDIKVTAFDYTRYGMVPGRIETVSATTFEDNKGNVFYRARLRLLADHAGSQEGDHMIIPGMTVIADIKTGEKSVLEYLFKPIVRASSEAFHER